MGVRAGNTLIYYFSFKLNLNIMIKDRRITQNAILCYSSGKPFAFLPSDNTKRRLVRIIEEILKKQ